MGRSDGKRSGLSQCQTPCSPFPGLRRSAGRSPDNSGCMQADAFSSCRLGFQPNKRYGSVGWAYLPNNTNFMSVLYQLKKFYQMLTLIYFEKNYQQCGNKKYKKYKYCCDLIVVWIPQVPRNCFRRFKKLDNFTKISQT